MMPVIRVSDATFKRLQTHARPFVDSPEDIVSLALDALERTKDGPGPSDPKPPTEGKLDGGGRLRQGELRAPLLQAMKELGGRATVRDVRRLLEARLADRLSEADRELVTSGDPRWWNAVCWERNALVREGIFRRDSERGVWEVAAPVGPTDPAAEDFKSDPTWRDDIEHVLDEHDLGSGVSLNVIYDNVSKLRQGAGRSVPQSLEATVRRTLEDNSTDSDNFRGVDIFCMPNGKGRGIWGLRRKQR